MFCEQCGSPLPEDSLFCEKCGAAVRQGPDGRYRWLVEINLLKDTAIPFTVWKIMLLACLAPLALTLILALVEGNLSRDLFPILGLFATAVIIVTVLTGIGYYLVFIPIRGSRYPVIFEMDQKGINHIQMPKNQDRTALLSWLGILAGALAGNPGAVGANLLAASRKQLYTEFRKVRKIRVDRRKKTIKLVSSDMTRNLIYSSAGDFEFVLEHILERCSKNSLKVQDRG